MTKNEICVLNRALDGREIMGLPGTGAEKISSLAAAQVKKRLTDKGILLTDTSLSPSGVVLLRRIQCYKEAAVHFRLGDMWAAVKEDGAGILLVHNPLYKRWSFQYCPALYANWAESFKAYSSFMNLATRDEAAGEAVSIPAFARKYDVTRQNSLSMSIFHGGTTTMDHTAFQCGGYMLCYDRIAAAIFSETFSELLHRWKEGLALS